MHYYFQIVFNSPIVVRKVLNGKIHHLVWLPILIVATANGFDFFESNEISSSENNLAVLLFFFQIGFGFLGLFYVIPGFYYLGSRFLGSHPTFKGIQKVISLSLIPEIGLASYQVLFFFSSSNTVDPNPIIFIIAKIASINIILTGLAVANRMTYQEAFMLGILGSIPCYTFI